MPLAVSPASMATADWNPRGALMIWATTGDELGLTNARGHTALDRSVRNQPYPASNNQAQRNPHPILITM